MFHLFAGYRYYPSGGVKDFIGSFETLEEAQNKAKGLTYRDWYHITDSNLNIIEED